MKIILIFSLIIIFCFKDLVACGQTFAEWWQQKKTRMKRLKQQVAALETLKDITQEGFVQATIGVDTIETNEEKELAADKGFIEHLGTVKPCFHDAPEVISCYALVEMLMVNVKSWLVDHSRSPLLSGREIELISSDLNLLVTKSKNDLNQLIMLTRDGELEMDDGDRYGSICEMEVKMRLTYETVKGCMRTVDHLLEAREQQVANEVYLKTILP